MQVVTVTVGVAGPEERKHLHRLGDDPVVATMITDDGSTLRIAVAGVHRAVVMGPLQRTADQGSLEVCSSRIEAEMELIAVVVVMAAIFLCGLVAPRLRERT